jgi:protein DGCR14
MSTPRPSDQPTRSLNRQQILDEDEYTEALSHIIARDFFPSLVHLDATNDYLDAIRSENPELIQSTVRRLEELATPATARRAPLLTPGATPYGAGPSDTPLALRTPYGEPPAKRVRYDTEGVTLDAFQARYTSEDNASFTTILDEENRKRREKWAWAWDAQKRVEEQRDKMLVMRERAMIEAPKEPGVLGRRVIEQPLTRGLITASGEPKSEKRGEDMTGMDDEDGKEKEDSGKGKEIMLVSGEEEGVVDVMARKKDTRPAGVDGWKFKVHNSFTTSATFAYFPHRRETLLCSHQMQMSRRITHLRHLLSPLDLRKS